MGEEKGRPTRSVATSDGDRRPPPAAVARRLLAVQAVRSASSAAAEPVWLFATTAASCILPNVVAVVCPIGICIVVRTRVRSDREALLIA